MIGRGDLTGRSVFGVLRLMPGPRGAFMEEPSG